MQKGGGIILSLSIYRVVPFRELIACNTISKKISEAMMPISTDALHHRAMLFDLTKPVTMSPKTFDEIWPYVDSVYTKLQQELLQAHGTVRVQKYI